MSDAVLGFSSPVPSPRRRPGARSGSVCPVAFRKEGLAHKEAEFPPPGFRHLSLASPCPPSHSICVWVYSQPVLTMVPALRSAVTRVYPQTGWEVTNSNTILCASVHLLMAIWVISNFGVLWIQLERTCASCFVDKCFFSWPRRNMARSCHKWIL